MARYIDADKLIVKLNETQIEFDRNYYGLGEAKQIVDNTPTANVVEKEKLKKARGKIQKLRGCGAKIIACRVGNHIRWLTSDPFSLLSDVLIAA